MMTNTGVPAPGQSFIGRGWSFPPTFDPLLPSVQMLEHEDDIVSSLHILLSTTRGERVMFPDYGCNLEELVFENLDTRMKTLMADTIRTAIIYFEPRITVDRVEFDDSQINDGLILIGIIYRVRETNSRFNFVYPFYKEQGTDINLSTTIQLLPDGA